MEETLIFLAYCWLLISVILWLWQAWRFTRMNHMLSESQDISIVKGSLPSLSLIVACRNEEQNLARNLPLWMAQEEVNFEIILVDDHSEDATPEFCEHASKSDPNIKFIRLDSAENRGKKWAIEAGIGLAKNEHLVFCDADCYPASALWLKAVAVSFSEGNDMVLGYGKIVGPSRIQALVDFETGRTALQFWHYASVKNPYMGVGRNLAYTKSLYYNNPDHKKHRDLLSGDDDLFVNSAGQGAKVAVLRWPEAYTLSKAPVNFRAWWKQKRRHYSAAWRYKLSHQLSLGLEGILALLFWVLMPLGLYYLPLEAMVLIATRFFMSFYPVRVQFSLFDKPGLQNLWPIWELVWVLSTFVLQVKTLILGAGKKW